MSPTGSFQRSLLGGLIAINTLASWTGAAFGTDHFGSISSIFGLQDPFDK